MRKGDPLQVGAVIRDLDKSMGGQKNAQLCSALCSAMLHAHTGNEERLQQSLDAPLWPPTAIAWAARKKCLRKRNWRATAWRTGAKTARPR